MAQISINGQTGLSATSAPDAYVNILSPQPGGAAGVPSNLGALVGTGSWGKPNIPIPFSTPSSLVAAFGQMTTAQYDLPTEATQACAFSNNFLGIRVTDGTDVAATVIIKDSGGTVTGATVTAIYTGSVGNTISMTFATGSLNTTAAPKVTATIQRAGYPAEVYPNLVSSTAGAFWANFVSAVNNGVSGVRGPSALVVATIGTSVLPPTLATVTLTGGTNGDQSMTSALQVGTQSSVGASTGMYALAGTNVNVFGLCGNSDSTIWASIQTFAESIGALAVVAFPNGTSSAAAITAKQTTNLSADWVKPVKDYISIFDSVNNLQRSISPIGETVGFRCSLNPWDSTLNKPAGGLPNFISTLPTSTPYSESEIGTLLAAGIDCIMNPIPVGNVYGYRTGCVASGNDDSYPMFTGWLARSFGSIMGQFIGALQSSQTGDATRARARAAFNSFMSTISSYIDSYNLTLDHTNNTPTTVGEGFMVGSLRVRYLGVVRDFLLNFQGGATVQVSVTTPLS